jgi:hypothetical protein
MSAGPRQLFGFMSIVTAGNADALSQVGPF